MTRRRAGFVGIGCLAAVGWIWLMLPKPCHAVHPAILRKQIRAAVAKNRTPSCAQTTVATEEPPANTVSTPVEPVGLKTWLTSEGLIDFNSASTDTTAVLARLSGHPLPPVLPIDMDSLLKLPQVHSVTVIPVIRSERRIVHILNRHYVPQEWFFAGSNKDELDAFSEEDRNRAYKACMREIEAVQKEQEELLREVIQRHHVRAIYGEGLTPRDRQMLEEFNSNPGWFLRLIRDEFEREYGALGRLFVSRELDAIIPAEDLDCLEAAASRVPDGSYRIDSEINERREDAMLECMMKGDEKDSVIVLGGDHDLTDNIQRQGKPCQYIRVATKKYWEFSEKASMPERSWLARSQGQ